MDFAIGGIAVALLVVGIVEAAKEFGLGGKGPRWLALGLGFFFTALAYGIDTGLIPAVAQPYIIWAVTAIAGAVAAMGYYDLGKRFFGAKSA